MGRGVAWRADAPTVPFSWEERLDRRRRSRREETVKSSCKIWAGEVKILPEVKLHPRSS